MKKEIIKTFVSACFAAAAVYFKNLALPLIVLLAAMCADYVTGMINAYINAALSSKTGVRGIVKKLCYMFAVSCGVVIDFVLTSAVSDNGTSQGSICFFGTLITVWLILNEVVSILENLSGIGVPLPKFLKNIAEKLKKSTEEKGESEK